MEIEYETQLKKKKKKKTEPYLETLQNTRSTYRE